MDDRIFLIDKFTGIKVVSILTNHGMTIDEMLRCSRYELAEGDDEGQLYDPDSGDYVEAWYDNLIVVDAAVFAQRDAASWIIQNGYYEAAVALMDDEIREDVHADYAPCSELVFLMAYLAKHKEVHGEEFKVN